MTDAERYQIFAELADVALSSFNGFSTHLGIYLTLLFAYCVVAYIAGAKLSRFQVIAVSAMFFLAAELQAVMMNTLAANSVEVGDLARTFLPPDAQVAEDSAFIRRSSFNRPAFIVGGTLWQLGIFTALLFMWNIRRGGKN
jgi:hypothetical protein